MTGYRKNSFIDDYMRNHQDDKKVYRNTFAKNRTFEYECALEKRKTDSERAAKQKYFQHEQKKLQRKLTDLRCRRLEISHGSSRDSSPVSFDSSRRDRSPGRIGPHSHPITSLRDEPRARLYDYPASKSPPARSRSSSISRLLSVQPDPSEQQCPRYTSGRSQSSVSRSSSDDLSDSGSVFSNTLSPGTSEQNLSSSLNENMFQWYKVWDTSTHGRRQKEPIKTRARSSSWNDLSRTRSGSVVDIKSPDRDLRGGSGSFCASERGRVKPGRQDVVHVPAIVVTNHTSGNHEHIGCTQTIIGQPKSRSRSPALTPHVNLSPDAVICYSHKRTKRRPLSAFM